MNGLEAFFRIPKSYGNYKNNFSGTICQKIVPALQYHAPNLSMARNKTDYEIMPMLASQSHTIISLSFGVRFLPFKIKAPAKSTLNTTRFYDKIKPESFRFIEQLFIIDNCSSAYFNRKEPSPMGIKSPSIFPRRYPGAEHLRCGSVPSFIPAYPLQTAERAGGRTGKTAFHPWKPTDHPDGRRHDPAQAGRRGHGPDSESRTGNIRL